MMADKLLKYRLLYLLACHSNRTLYTYTQSNHHIIQKLQNDV